jgi:guanylate kinase
MAKRLKAAKAELEYAVTGGHDLVLINDDLERAGGILEKVAMGYEGWQSAGDRLPEFDLKELDA